MRRIDGALAALCFSLPLAAQVVAPPEIRDAALRDLQQKHMAELKAVGVAIGQYAFPYSFYFSRTLDLDEKDQRTRDQRSIQFARNAGQTIVQITGNYYASYSGELMTKTERAQRTFQDVMLPILQVEVAQFANDPAVQGYGLEIAHHVRKKMLGVSTENPENVVLMIGKPAAARLVAAKDAEGQQAALREASLFVNQQPASWWGEEPADPPAAAAAPATAAPTTAKIAPLEGPPMEGHNASPDELKALQTERQDTLDRIVRELGPTAHFVSYAPPSFISFHKSTYLQFSFSTALEQSDDGSRYKAAALAFDEHIAHLVRPALGYFKDEAKFDGIDFSTAVRSAGQTEGGVAVEYIFDFRSLRCYASYDCTGQQLVNAGFVLVNGERISLDLQGAEAGKR